MTFFTSAGMVAFLKNALFPSISRSFSSPAAYLYILYSSSRLTSSSLGSSSSSGSSSSFGRSILDLILIRVAAMTRNSLMTSRSSSSILFTYSRYCSVIVTIGISYILTLFFSIKCKRRSSGPSNTLSFTSIADICTSPS